MTERSDGGNIWGQEIFGVSVKTTSNPIFTLTPGIGAGGPESNGYFQPETEIYARY